MFRTSVAAWLSLAPLLVQAQSIPARAYTPLAGPCPDNFTLVRLAGSSADNQTLSASEAAYIQARKSQAIPQAWKNYLSNVEGTNVTLPSYVSGILNGSICESPNFAIATSGGGYRAATFGAGVLNALDGRNETSNRIGLGGLLQAATYITGLSGGSWLVLSLAQAEFPTIEQLVFGYSADSANPGNNSWGGWNANFSFYTPTGNNATDAAYQAGLLEETLGKYSVGYPVTMADVWSRILARHFVNGTSAANFFDESSTHGAGTLLSSLAESESFASYSVPFPIVTADISAPGQNNSSIEYGEIVPISNPIFEFTPFEVGSFDPVLSAFVPTKYLGTRNNSVCVTNYDQLSFALATSSDLLNALNVTGTLETQFGTLIAALKNLTEPGIELDASVLPNPFYNVAPDTFVASDQSYLSFVDGGEDGEGIPFQPLLVKAREVDVIFAIDAFGDSENNFSAGGSLIATKNRTDLYPEAYSFPTVPTSIENFVAQNLSTRPTFFGCDVPCEEDSTPLVIYLANGGPPRNGDPPLTNSSVFQSAFNLTDVQGILEQTYTVAIQGYPADPNAIIDPEWPGCLACAVVDRARDRAGETRSGMCQTCFERYCWSASA